MASANKVILIGNCGRDPEVREFESGAMANFSIATSRKYKDKNGTPQEETEWHRISVFGRLAEIARDYIKRGVTVYVEGRLRTRKYTDKEGVERFQTEVLADAIQMLSRVTTEGGEAPQARQAQPQRSHGGYQNRTASKPSYDDDPPF